MTRAMATVSFPRPGTATLKLTLLRETTLKGPVYGEAREDWTPPRLTNTWVHVCKSAGMCTRGRRCDDVSVGCSLATSSRKLARVDSRRRDSSASDAATLGSNSPGTARPSPYTKSAGDAPMSGLTVVRMDSKAMGSFQNHLSGSSAPRAMRASLRRLWNLSTIPLASGWYGVVILT